MKKIILTDPTATAVRGKPMFFKGMTGFGPMYTANCDEAMRFDTEEEAMRHPAVMHPLCDFTPRYVNDTP